MGLSIQEILAAQNRAANATKKPVAAPAPKPAEQKSISDVLAAQRAAAHVGAKPAVAPKPEPRESKVSDIIANQQRVVAEQKAFHTNGVSPMTSAEQKAVIESVRARYDEFIKKLDKELEGQELYMESPAEPKAEEPKAEEEPVFNPVAPEVVMEPVAPDAPVNGISLGDEMGGQVAMVPRSRRRRRVRGEKAE